MNEELLLAINRLTRAIAAAAMAGLTQGDPGRYKGILVGILKQLGEDV